MGARKQATTFRVLKTGSIPSSGRLGDYLDRCNGHNAETIEQIAQSHSEVLSWIAM